MSELKNVLINITEEKRTKIIPDNIKEGVTIFGVTGTHKAGTDTTDANAVSEDILAGKSAYVNGKKVDGTMVNHGSKVVTPSTIGDNVYDIDGYVDNFTVQSIQSSLKETTEPNIIDWKMAGGGATATHTFTFKAKPGCKMLACVMTRESADPVVSAGWNLIKQVVVSPTDQPWWWQKLYVYEKMATQTSETFTSTQPAGAVGRHQAFVAAFDTTKEVEVAWSYTTPGKKESSVVIPESFNAGDMIFATYLWANTSTYMYATTSYVRYSTYSGGADCSRLNALRLGTTQAASTSTLRYSDGTQDFGAILVRFIPDEGPFIARNIKAYVNIGGIEGTYTADGTASSNDIIDEQIAYVKGAKVVGTLKDVGSVTFIPSDVEQIMTDGRYINSKVAKADITKLVDYKTSLGLTNYILNKPNVTVTSPDFSYDCRELVEISTGSFELKSNSIEYTGGCATIPNVNRARGTFEISCKIPTTFTPIQATEWYNCSCILGCELGSEQQDFGIVITKDGYFAIGYSMTSVGSTTIKANDGKPHHLVLLVSGTYLKLYIDGILEKTVTYSMSGTVPTNYGVFWNAAQSITKGEAYNVNLYATELTDAEIIQNYLDFKILTYGEV